MMDGTRLGDDVGSVLIVDDQPSNLAVLSKLLGEEGGYKVRAVTSGERALEAARLAPPDCVLLDVAMPGMDGYATCEAFRREPLLVDVPIIFVTAFDDAAHKVRAFRTGGRDYVTKPFQADEVLARVNSQMRMARLDRELKAHNANLMTVNAKLLEVNDLKGRVTAMLVHDVRSPLSVIGSILNGTIDDEALQDARESYRKINGLLSDMLELYRSEQQPPAAPAYEPVELGALLTKVVAGARHLAADCHADLTFTPTAEPMPVLGDTSRLDRVFSNLVDNALKFTPAGGVVRIVMGAELGVGVESGLRFATVSVVDTGPGIAAADLPYVFDPYRQTPTARGRGGFGLGLAIVQRIVADHHGRVQVHSQVGVGTEFRIYLPR